MSHLFHSFLQSLSFVFPPYYRENPLHPDRLDDSRPEEEPENVARWSTQKLMKKVRGELGREEKGGFLLYIIQFSFNEERIHSRFLPRLSLPSSSPLPLIPTLSPSPCVTDCSLPILFLPQLSNGSPQTPHKPTATPQGWRSIRAFQLPKFCMMKMEGWWGWLLGTSG